MRATASRLVINITDVNDKIYDAARAQNRDSAELAAEMSERYRQDTDALELGRPDDEPLASETIAPIVDYIQTLVAGAHAYEAEGDVYFRVRSDPAYGSLSHRRLENMDQGEDVEGADRKEDPLDFALWKAHKPGEDTVWQSPWGPGRPGWHIECSAMAESLLGVGFDIHGGGSDLVFPHHENEAAQTRAARGTELAKLWMHNGMIQLTGEKMAKSQGNIAALHEVLAEHGPQTVVMYLISGHYRQPLAFSESELNDAARRVHRIRDALRRLDAGRPSPPDMTHHAEAFFDALANDFNTPAALASLFEWVREANRRAQGVGDADLREMLAVLGLGELEPLQALDDVASSDPEATSLLAAARAGAQRTGLPGGRPDARGAAPARVGDTRWTGRPRADPRHDALIIYGRNPVREALRGRRASSIGEVWATAGAAREPWLRGVRVRSASGEEIERRCGSSAHQGVCAGAGPFIYAEVDELLSRANPLLVALDQVQDPQNLGSICRTAECAGAAGVVIPERRAAEVTAAVCKASAGAVEHLPVARVRNMADFLADARRAGCWCYGASAAEEGGARQPLAYDAPDYAGAGVVLVLGSEGGGLRPRVAKACDELIALPLLGRVESLGVSAAAAAILYEILQRRHARG